MPARKIAIAANTAWNLVNFRQGVILALVREGYDVVALTPRDQYVSRLIKLGCRFSPLAMDNKGTSPLGDLFLLWRFLTVMKAEAPDIFLGYTIKPNVYGSLAARVLGIPVINNISGLGTAFIHRGWVGAVVRMLYALSLRTSKRVFFQNGDDQTLFIGQHLVRKEQAAVIPGSGIDLTKFHPEIKSKSGDGKFRFLLVARLLRDKGVGEYVDAARLVRLKYNNVTCQLLGFLEVKNRTAIDKSTVEGWISEGHIEYLGSTDDVRPFLAQSDCIVLPSYREGTPRTLLEAAAMARPLIATDVPGCREVVDDGVNGFLCKVRDSEDLAAKMLKMVDLPPRERALFGAAGRRKVELQFDEKIVIKSYLTAIEAALSGKPM